MRGDDLNPYQHCPGGPDSGCAFEAQPVVRIGSDEAEGIAVFVCTTCGHGVTRPAMPDVSALYEDRSSQDFQGQDGRIAAAIKDLSFTRQARRVLQSAGFTGGRLIDFGCGSGMLSSALAKVVPEGSTVTALDFHDAPPPLLAGADYLPFARAQHLEETADLVTCFHVLEHDDDSAAMLRRVTRFIKPGGVLVAEVPHVDCIWAGLFGENWDNWYLPYHRVHFSRASLRNLMVRAQLEVIREQDVSIPSIGRSLARAAGARNTLPFVMMSALAYPVQYLGEKLGGRPSALRVIARKSS